MARKQEVLASLYDGIKYWADKAQSVSKEETEVGERAANTAHLLALTAEIVREAEENEFT